VTLLVIMATANHYLLDAAGGAVVTVACVAATRPQVRTRLEQGFALSRR
jgi:hypothetical protein